MLKNYLIITWKVMLRRKTFTIITLSVIALYLMMMTIMATFYDIMVSPYPPEVNKENTLMAGGMFLYKSGLLQGRRKFDLETIERYIANMEKPEVIAWMKIGGFQLPGDTRYWTEVYANAAFWEIYQFKFLEGRSFTSQEESQAAPVAIISEKLRQEFFGEKPALDKTIEIKKQTFKVIGVIEDIHSFANLAGDVFLPYTIDKNQTDGSKDPWRYTLIFLAHEPDDIPPIQAELASAVGKIPILDPNQFDEISSVALSQDEKLESQLKMPIILLFIFSGLFLALPASTLLNINTSRIAERYSEIGIRKAFGANIWHLIGQFIIENLIFSLIGGILGFFLSLVVFKGFVEVLLAQLEVIFPGGSIILNWRVFLLSLVMAMIYGFFTGVYPAWKMSRVPPVTALKS